MSYACNVYQRGWWVNTLFAQAIGERFVSDFINVRQAGAYDDWESNYMAFIKECSYGAEVELREGELYEFPVRKNRLIVDCVLPILSY